MSYLDDYDYDPDRYYDYDADRFAPDRDRLPHHLWVGEPVDTGFTDWPDRPSTPPPVNPAEIPAWLQQHRTRP